MTNVAPNEGAAATDTSVVVTGTAFDGATAVTVAGGSVPFAFVSSTRINAVVPAGGAGDLQVSVETPAGISPVTDAAKFTRR